MVGSTYAVWDISYYAGAWGDDQLATSFKDLDILFLIRLPWLARVWNPIL